MKPLLTLPLLLLSLISFPSWSETENDLYYLDGIAYKKFTDVPFTGEVNGFNQISSLAIQGNYKDGKREGSLFWWYESGKKMAEQHYKDGKRDGAGIWWYENGTKKYEEYYKEGLRTGLWVGWYDNGTKKYEDRTGGPIRYPAVSSHAGLECPTDLRLPTSASASGTSFGQKRISEHWLCALYP